MYEKINSILLKATTSMTAQNLSIYSQNNLKTIATISKNTVILTTTNETGTQVKENKIVPKVSKDCLTASNNENSLFPNLIQSKFVNVSNRVVLVISSTKGIFFYEEDGNNLISFHNFQNLQKNQSEETSYARGITVVNSDLIAIGTSSASILLFEVSPKGNNITMVQQIPDKNLNCGISDLISQNGFLFAADTEGNLFGWDFKESSNPKMFFSVPGKYNSCTCLGLSRNYLAASYGNGLISIYDVEEGILLVDIAAHARWINCLDFKQDKLVSAGEDCFIRIWEVNEINGKLKINCIQSEKITDTFLCGVVFDKGTNEILVSGFDTNEILIFKSR